MSAVEATEARPRPGGRPRLLALEEAETIRHEVMLEASHKIEQLEAELRRTRATVASLERSLRAAGAILGPYMRRA
jgi:hypothetical protein